MESALKRFERAINEFAKNPSNETFNVCGNVLCSVIHENEKVSAVAIIKPSEIYAGTLVKIDKVVIEGRSHYLFYTSEEKEKASPIRSSIATLSLRRLIKLAIEANINALVVNPGFDNDFCIDIEMAKHCLNIVEEYESKSRS